jgi:hypothetical protein
LAVLGFEFRASCLLGRCATIWVTSSALISPLGVQFSGSGHLAQVRRPEIGELVLLGLLPLTVCRG